MLNQLGKFEQRLANTDVDVFKLIILYIIRFKSLQILFREHREKLIQMIEKLGNAIKGIGKKNNYNETKASQPIEQSDHVQFIEIGNHIQIHKIQVPSSEGTKEQQFNQNIKVLTAADFVQKHNRLVDDFQSLSQRVTQLEKTIQPYTDSLNTQNKQIEELKSQIHRARKQMEQMEQSKIAKMKSKIMLRRQSKTLLKSENQALITSQLCESVMTSIYSICYHCEQSADSYISASCSHVYHVECLYEKCFEALENDKDFTILCRCQSRLANSICKLLPKGQLILSGLLNKQLNELVGKDPRMRKCSYEECYFYFIVDGSEKTSYCPLCLTDVTGIKILK